jgi:hypothetical protein
MKGEKRERQGVRSREEREREKWGKGGEKCREIERVMNGERKEVRSKKEIMGLEWEKKGGEKLEKIEWGENEERKKVRSRKKWGGNGEREGVRSRATGGEN